MKGLIMAGGKGERLRPFTNHLPKPLFPILNRPVMEYSIEWLKSYGITEVAVTVCYLKEKIKDYFGYGTKFGVKLYYFDEEIPLGTAGGVKKAENFLDEPFIILSGDVLTGIDMTDALKFHHDKEALLTIITRKNKQSSDYGSVLTGADDSVTGFVEKPLSAERLSDQINTGIYIAEPDIFDYIPKETPFDFSYDLFPNLIDNGRKLYAYETNGYWCDIGRLERYFQAQKDVLEGEVPLFPKEDDSIGKQGVETAGIRHYNNAFIKRLAVSCPKNAFIKVLLKIIGESGHESKILSEGIKFIHSDRSWTDIFYDVQKSGFVIYSHSENKKLANEFANYYLQKIKTYQKV